MSVISRNNFVYLAHPRTASMATQRALKQMCGRRMKWERTQPHHVGLKDCPNRTGNEFVFTTIRNPLDAITSWYQLNPALHPKGFEWFVENYKHNFLEQDGRMWYFIDQVDWVMRFETLQQDFNTVCLKFQRPRFRILPFNTTKGKRPYHDYHNHNTIKMMWQRFPKDMALYYEYSTQYSGSLF